MSDLDAWLAAMPVADVKARIARLERELQVLKLLEAQHKDADRPVRVADSGTVKRGTTVRQPPFSTRRLSPQREAIIGLIREHPDGMSPVEVARALDMEPNPIQTNMSRMVSAGQLVRVEQGRYRLPAHMPAADLLSGTEGDSDNGNGEATEP